MSVERIASRYAKSLIELAAEGNKLEAIKGDVDNLASALKSRDFLMLVKSPIIPASKKAQIFNVLFEGKLDTLTLSFLRILVNKNREEHIPEVVQEFMAQYKKMKNIMPVKITTASAISPTSMAGIQSKIAAEMPQSAAVELETVVNPDLIGGFTLEFNNQIYDASVASKLEQLRKSFK